MNTNAHAHAPRVAEPVIRVRGLRRRYGSGKTAFDAVRGLDFDVYEGEVFALLGTNGAGKTSTFDLLEGLASPTDGEVEVFGLDPRRDRKLVRPRVGTMLQSGGLPGELTVRETLEMWQGTCATPAPIDEILAKVSMTDRADVRVASLSGGEKRRVDLGCALLGRPRLLFLDEPTTGLDPENRRETWKLLAELKASGVTMVLTTHYLDEAETLADRIAIMHKGEIARHGTLREIVDGHPARIAFDHPGVRLPKLDNATIDTEDGRRVVIRTHHLQQHLHQLLDWARTERIAFDGLEASAASLESVFLDVATSDTATAHSAVGDIAAHRTPATAQIGA